MELNSSVNYKNCLVAFIDVMGFKNLLKDTVENRSLLGNYYRIISEIVDFDKAIAWNNLKIITISDSIIYTVELKGDYEEDIKYLQTFIFLIASLQFELASSLSVWTRGAISIGQLDIDPSKNRIVGQGYVNAYEMEREADYARVILDPKLFGYFNKNPHDVMNNMNEPFVLAQQVSPVSLSVSPWISNYITVDWLRIGLHESELIGRGKNMDDFFRDLKSRQFLSHDIAIKTQKLLGYFLESTLRFKKKNKTSGLSTGYNEISSHLESMMDFKFSPTNK